jgi:hypothetical protein
MQDTFTGQTTCLRGRRLPGRKRGDSFDSITSDDWKRSLASARQQKNAVSEQIRTAISSSSRKTK